MIYHFEQRPIWHVIFHPGKSIWGGQFKHVSLAGFSNDTWLHLDLHQKGTSTATLYHHDAVHDYLTYLLAHYTVLRFGPSNEAANLKRYLPLTCVSFVKHTLGIRSSALRPDGLFRNLTSNYDVEVMNGPESTQGNAGSQTTTAQGES